MKVVVLLGTSHSIQRGKINSPIEFRDLLVHECKKNNVKAIAEEIENKADSVSEKLCLSMKYVYLNADPDFNERKKRGIPNNIDEDIWSKFRNKYPEIDIWPTEPSKENLPNEVWEEYHKKTEASHRMREQVWLEKIIGLNSWPLLFICGANHFEPFSKLLNFSGFRVIETHGNWEPA